MHNQSHIRSDPRFWTRSISNYSDPREQTLLDFLVFFCLELDIFRFQFVLLFRFMRLRCDFFLYWTWALNYFLIDALHGSSSSSFPISFSHQKIWKTIPCSWKHSYKRIVFSMKNWNLSMHKVEIRFCNLIFQFNTTDVTPKNFSISLWFSHRIIKTFMNGEKSWKREIESRQDTLDAWSGFQFCHPNFYVILLLKC